MQKRFQKRIATRRNNASRPSRRASSESSDNELQDLFLDELADIYNAEQQLTKALPKMARAAEAEELREAFEVHLGETRGQISRIEEAARTLGVSIKRKKCKGMEGLIEESEEMIEEQEDSSAIDATLIASAQKVEHYEIASYGTLCAWAKILRHNQALNFLKQNLSEEKATDDKLTMLAESLANLKAEQESQ